MTKGTEPIREIKFRAWDKGKKSMRSFMDLEDFCGQFYAYGSQVYDLMQYTGLKDKNGVEIYEGDICEYTANTPRRGSTYHLRQVVWYTPRASFRLLKLGNGADIDSVRFRAHLAPDKAEELAVIGNIYENPELLSPSDVTNQSKEER